MRCHIACAMALEEGAPRVGARVRPPRNRRSASVTFAPLRLAGIRADGRRRFAFPPALPGSGFETPVQSGSAGRLPLRGQHRFGGDLRQAALSCFPFNRLCA